MVNYHLALYDIYIYTCTSYKELRKTCKALDCPYKDNMPKTGDGYHGMCCSFVTKDKRRVIIVWAEDVISLCHEIVHAKNAIYDWIASPIDKDCDEPEAWLSHHLIDVCLAAYNDALPLRYAKA